MPPGGISHLSTLAALLLGLLLFAAGAFAATPRCGEERWAVKTLADADALKVAQTPMPVRISELAAISAPSRGVLDAHADSRMPAELRSYRVQGFLVGFKHEADDDFHIVIADLEDPSKTMIVEIPAGHCVPAELQPEMDAMRRQWEQRFGKASAKFKNVAAHHIRVEFSGPGFFDFIHGQTGVAKNGFELHPVRAWRELFALGAQGAV